MSGGVFIESLAVREISRIVVSRIPEPSTLALLSIGILGLIGYGWRRGTHAR